MSDLFAPMPLPDRPVQQTADIAAREAAAKQQEIDTRMRERMETSRLQAIHEIGVSKESYQLSLQELERDYRKEQIEEASKPSRSYARSTSSRGSSSYQRTQQSNGNLVVNQEKLRLSSQEMMFGTDLRRAANEFVLHFRESGRNMEEGMDGWQNQVVGFVDNLYFNEDPYVSSLNTNAQIGINKLITARTNWVSDQIFKAIGDRALEQSEHDYWSATMDDVTHFTMSSDTGEVLGIDMALGEIPSWNELIEHQNSMVAEKYVDSWKDPDTRVHGMLQDAVANRLIAAGIEEAKGRIPLAQTGSILAEEMGSPSQIVASALEVVTGSKLWGSIQEGSEYGSLFGDITEKDIESGIWAEMSTLEENFKIEQEVALTGFWTSHLQGENQGMAPDVFYNRLIGMGVTRARALSQAKAHAEEQGNAPWLSNKNMQKDWETNRLRSQAGWELTLQRILEQNPEAFGSAESTMNQLVEMQNLGMIADVNDSAWTSALDKGQKNLLDQHSELFKLVDTWGNQLNQAFRTDDDRASDSVFPNYEAGFEPAEHLSTEQLTLRVRAEVRDMILNPGEAGRLDNASMAAWAKTRFRHYMTKMRFSGKTYDDIAGMTRFRGGEIPEFTTTVYAPLPGRVVGQAGLLMQSSYTEDFDDQAATEWLGMDATAKAQSAVEAITLSGYSGLLEEDIQSEEDMDNILRGATREGLINSYELNRANRTVSVQMADNSTWIVRDLDYGAPGYHLRDTRNAEMDLVELEHELEQTVQSGAGSLTVFTQDPETGEYHESPTAALTTIEVAADNMVKRLSQLGKDLSSGAWRPRFGMALPLWGYLQDIDE